MTVTLRKSANDGAHINLSARVCDVMGVSAGNLVEVTIRKVTH